MNLSQLMYPCVRLVEEFLISPPILNKILPNFLLDELSGENSLIIFFPLRANITQSL